MKTFQAKSGKRILLTAAAGAMCMQLAGCGSDGSDSSAYYTYGEPYYYTSDLYYMGSVYDPYYYYYKQSAASLTLPGETIVEPLTYHSECTCFVRQATFTGQEDYERTRTDTVQFLDASGIPLSDSIKTVLATKVLHKRHIVNVAGSRQADILIDLTMDVVRDSVVKGISNGTISGSYNDQAINEGTVTNVTRVWNDTAFGYPESGSLFVDRPNIDMTIEFQPDSTATVTITDDEGDKTYVQTIDANFIETSPVLNP